MRIINSQVASQARQREETVQRTLNNETVQTLSQQQTQQRFNQGPTVMDVRSDGLVGNRTLQASNEASVLVDLTSSIEDRTEVTTGAQVTGPNGEQSSHASHTLVEAFNSLSETRAMTIRQTQLQQPNESSATFLQVNRISSEDHQQNITVNFEGTAITDDEREISFLMQFEFDRSTHTEFTSRFTGNRNFIDPITLNLNGESASLSDEVFSFDLNANGRNDTIAKTGSGTGYLVYDRNNNGLVDDGSELFGPTTGTGYLELAELDDDGNGWIDENDAAFSQLGLWQFTETGTAELSKNRAAMEGRTASFNGSFIEVAPVGEYQTLSNLGVGALSLQSENTQYDLYGSGINSSNKEVLGEVKKTGIALMENGAVAVMQELNLRNFMQQPSGISSILIDENGSFNPLLEFQNSTDLRITLRNEETQVRIVSQFPTTGTVRQNPLQRTANLSEQQLTSPQELKQLSEALSQQTAQSRLANQANSSQAAVYERMQAKLDFTRSNAGPTPNHYIPEAAEHRFLDDLPNKWDFNQSPEDGRLEQLKQLVKSLKEIHQQQIDSLEKLGLYQRVGKD